MLAARVTVTLDLVIVPGPRLIVWVVGVLVIGVLLAMREALLDAAGFVWELIVKSDAAKTASATPPLDSVASALEQIRQRDTAFAKDGFLQQASETIRQVQHARTELTPELARERLADSAWLQLSRQVGQAGVWRERVVPTTTLRSVEVVDADYEGLKAHGFTDEDIWDIGAIAAFFALSNRMANLIGMRPNDEFHLLGRVAKAGGKPA